MKSFGRILALFALLGAKQLIAAPSLAFGDNAELFLTGSVSVEIDDNIYLRNSNKIDDLIMTFTPGFDLVFGRNSQTSGNFYYRHSFQRYSDNSQQDTDLANVGLNSLYSNGKTRFDFGASYTETAQNEPSVPGAIVERETTRARAVAEFGVSQKTSLSFGLLLDDMSYRQNNFSDHEAWTLPVDLYYEYSPKLQISAGYRYRSTDVATGIDTRDHFFNIGARGEFTPKLMGQIRVGYTSRDFRSTRNDENRLGLDANLNYTYSDKTSVFVRASNDFGTSALGTSTQDLSFALGINSRMDEQWAWNGSISFRSSDYGNREDDFIQLALGTSYRYSETLSFSATYAHRKNNSSSALLDFKNNVFSLAANLRY